MTDYIAVSGAEKNSMIKRGLAYNDGFSPFTQSFEHGHYGHGELLIRYMPTPAAFKVFTQEFSQQANEIAVRDHYGVPGHVFGDILHDMYGPHVSNYNLWLRKIKKAFDPNGSSESTYYISGGE
jgi:FAD/FMN-containing dehydrogenase